MKFVINLVILLIALEAHAETVLRFQENITSHAKYLGDLLLISPDKNHWSQMALDSQPQDGELLTKGKIITWLQHQKGPFAYQWKGANSVTVRQITLSFANDLLNKAQTALAAQLKQQAYTQVELSNKSTLKNSAIALEKFRVQLPHGYPVAKRVCVRLNYKKHSIPVWFAVKTYQSVLVAQHKIKQHSVLHPNDVTLKKRNIAGLKSAPLTQFPKTTWLTKSVNKNQILSQVDVQQQPEVLQGQKVQVSIQQQSISILIEAIAQNNGYKGETVRMKNPRTNKYFAAVITGKNQAEISA